MSSLNDDAAVISYGSGVSSSDLAAFTRSIADAAARRIEGVGDEQYGQGELQKFETATVDHYVDELIDEVADIQAYLAIIVLKVLALRRRNGLTIALGESA